MQFLGSLIGSKFLYDIPVFKIFRTSLLLNKYFRYDFYWSASFNKVKIFVINMYVHIC